VTKLRFCLTLGGLILFSAPAAAVDLAKIDRKIAKEPAYRSRNPTYCLLVFGMKAETRVWLVRDGDLLYVDRNGNGDLTEKGKRITAKKDEDGDGRKWGVGQIIDPKTKARYDDLGIYLSKDYSYILVSGNAWGFKEVCSRATFVSFAKRPKDAPVIHFFGPLALRLSVSKGGARDLVARVGTPGLGKGTFADATWSIHRNVQGAMAVEAEFPQRKRAKFTLHFNG
jgi:hypothetical protein